MDDNRFRDLEDLKSSIEIGLDIECMILGQRYYIGWSNHKRIIALCPDGDGDFFETLDEMLDFKIEGKPLKDIWYSIEIISM